ncbi:patatin-like phospholipase family protein [Anaerotruncus sp. AF02-27]|uniref:patatin-like phospholipase family protein n=1 Tax=Anaerotruncus TaxID=244127 RepID=UPI000E4D41FF|nr:MULTISPECIES: patatin-like phospholipase family protein [Anaerotruncus]RGX54355.1 patatin-like phospholipase family protein [Anaerotruncus sp. AF02-27]
MEKTALVLSGGGSRGAYEIGVWRALGELDERFSIVTGTSVGALNGAVIAQGSFEEAEKLWRELETSRVFDLPLDEKLPREKKWLEAVKLFGKAAFEQGGADTSPLREILESYLDEETIRQSPVAFGLMTVQVPAMRPVPVWADQLPKGKLIDYLLASSALFPAIRPHRIDGEYYIDGGYYDNMPMQMAAARGASRIIAVNMDAPGVIRREKAAVQAEVREIRSYWNLGSVLLFDPNSARQNMRLGYLDTMRSYGVCDGFAFAFVKGTLQTVVRQYYGAFYEVCELLGFHSVRHRFLDSVAYKAVQKRVFRRGIAPPALRGFALDGMESAAELFGLQTGTLYSLARFGQRLSEAVEATEIPDALEGLDFWADTAQAAVTAALELAGRAARAKYLYRIIRACIAHRRPLNLLPVAAVMTDEFSAALYLALWEYSTAKKTNAAPLLYK